jgi:hypothetical protein
MKKDPNLLLIASLVFISLMMKLVIIAVPFFIPHAGLDLYDQQYYFGASQQFINGSYPIGFNYPPLALIPMVISYILSTGNQLLFYIIFQLLMCICDAVVIFCIYMIGLKFLTRQQSFGAGLLYTISISVAYFSLTKFDAFPAALLMLAIYFIVYNESGKGYVASVIGLFTKVYPIVIFPFLYLYDREKFSNLLAMFLIAVSVTGFIFRDSIISYIQISLLRSAIYVNTPSYVLGIPQIILYPLAIFIIIITIIYMGLRGKNNVRALLSCIGISIITIVFCMEFHSPQFYVWYIPIFCLLVVDSVYATLAFCAVSTMVYLEFPLFYGVLYQNDKFLIAGAQWFFVAEWMLMIVMVYLATRNISRENQIN